MDVPLIFSNDYRGLHRSRGVGTILIPADLCSSMKTRVRKEPGKHFMRTFFHISFYLPPRTLPYISLKVHTTKALLVLLFPNTMKLIKLQIFECPRCILNRQLIIWRDFLLAYFVVVSLIRYLKNICSIKYWQGLFFIYTKQWQLNRN